jgi:hypothetical protein
MVTASLMLAVYAIINGNQAGWVSAQTVGLLGGAAALLALFLGIEARVSSPLMPLGLFRLRNVATANLVGVLWAAAMFAWFFLSALYLQLVLGYSPLQVGLGFLPTNLIMGAFSLGLSALGCGAGMAFNPLLLAAMSDVAPEESGLASGVVNTAFMMGGALGLAVLASLAASRTDNLRASGHGPLAALDGGYHAAFLVGAIFGVATASLGAVLLRAGLQAPAEVATEAD